MVEAFDYAQQAQREVSCSNAAVERYRKAAAKMDPTSLPPGQRLMFETVRPIAAAIQARREAVGVQTTGKPPTWHAPFLAFDAEVLAVVGLAPALRAWVVHRGRVGIPMSAYGRAVASTLRDQADYDRFVQSQQAAQRLATADIKKDIRRAEAGQEKAQVRLLTKVLSDIREDEALRTFRRLNPKADRRGWSRFAARIEGARSGKWDEYTQQQVGAQLASCLDEGAPQWFEIKRHGPGPEHRQPIYLCMTEAAMEQLEDAEARAELAYPNSLPMLVPPNPWRYVDNNKDAS